MNLLSYQLGKKAGELGTTYPTNFPDFKFTNEYPAIFDAMTNKTNHIPTKNLHQAWPIMLAARRAENGSTAPGVDYEFGAKPAIGKGIRAQAGEFATTLGKYFRLNPNYSSNINKLIFDLGQQWAPTNSAGVNPNWVPNVTKINAEYSK